MVAGMPMATWLFFAVQFLNKKLIVDMLGTGVFVGRTKPTKSFRTVSKVGTDEVKRALNKLVDGGVDGENRRSKAQELKAKAKASLENVGSSCMNQIHFAA